MKRPLLALTLPLYVLDQLTKWLVLRHIEPNDEIAVIPGFFSLVQVHNTGAAFGMLHDSNYFFIGLSVVFLVALLVFWRRGAFQDRGPRVAAALLTAGILGNLTDRLTHHFVVDFLLFDLHVPFAHPWPAFNVADSCICVAAGLFVIGSFFESKRVKT
ncbi:MAG: signal peptidase II [Chthoniobacterales bacterium]